MKKYLSILLLSGAITLCSASFAFAQGDTGQNSQKQENVNVTVPVVNNSEDITSIPPEKTPEQMKADIQELRDVAKQKIEDLKASIGKIKNKTKATMAQARILVREDALARFDQAIEKVSPLEDRVNAQITKLENKGFNVTPAKDLVGVADEKILEAKQNSADASTLLSSSTNELAKDDKAKLVQLSQDIQSAIKDAQQSLNDAVKYLKTLIITTPIPSTEATATQ